SVVLAALAASAGRAVPAALEVLAASAVSAASAASAVSDVLAVLVGSAQSAASAPAPVLVRSPAVSTTRGIPTQTTSMPLPWPAREHCYVPAMATTTALATGGGLSIQTPGEQQHGSARPLGPAPPGGVAPPSAALPLNRPTTTTARTSSMRARRSM